MFEPVTPALWDNVEWLNESCYKKSWVSNLNARYLALLLLYCDSSNVKKLFSAAVGTSFSFC
jgi:hypothetical protein